VITRLEVFSASESAPELQLGNLALANSDPVQIRDIDGLGPVKANINTTALASGRGEVLQGTTTGKRNIVLSLGLNPDWAAQTMSSLRQLLYAYFLPEAWCKLRFFSDHLPVVDIEGYVESFEPNIFSQDPEIQVSIVCPKPDFIEADATYLSGVVDTGEEEHVFDYLGTVPTGFEMRVESSAENVAYTGNLAVIVKSPTVPQTFEVDPITIDATRNFKLSTVRNHKRVQNVTTSDGTVLNRLSAMTDVSVWPELKPGENALTVAAAEAGQTWTLAYFNRYGGL